MNKFIDKSKLQLRARYLYFGGIPFHSESCIFVKTLLIIIIYYYLFYIYVDVYYYYYYLLLLFKFVIVGSCVKSMNMTNVGSCFNNINSFLWMKYIRFKSIHTLEMISHQCTFSSCL